jgi:hypothetical protein
MRYAGDQGYDIFVGRAYTDVRPGLERSKDSVAQCSGRSASDAVATDQEGRRSGSALSRQDKRSPGWVWPVKCDSRTICYRDVATD